ncbi:MFS transporter, SHS family, sialic acid transporter [Actinacidiphila yanglinensis]|uniref:MFS transporter, SHS family, sialic acid transporter n=1 Tax=Actinacidiphila yanglinensis TaxID=310779 RepID=A0A1H6DW38_9ACTN|nr:sialate:H+ symport family MFS transporter [Actinacidiphila yanglinensis]SEG89294.1 MFS transporter, SHS family, sialic acid transporter [Actinacidiphila yanglinensis]
MSYSQAPPLRWRAELSGRDWKAFSAAWLGYAMDGFDFVLITLVLTEISKDFHLSTVTAATLVSAAFVSRWFGGLAIGALGDRFGRRPAMVLSIGLYAVGSVLCGFSWGYWSLFAFRMVVGLGMAGEYGTSVTYLIESWPKRLRNTASGMILSGYPLGGVLAAKVYAWVVPHTSWRVLFWIGIVPVVLAIYLRRRLPEATEWKEAVDAGNRPVSATGVLFSGGRRRWVNVLVCLAAAVALIVVLRGQNTAITLVLIAAIVACFVSLTVQFAGRLWPVVVALMVTVFSAFLYSWPLQSLLPTYLKTSLHYNPDQVSNALLYAGCGYAVGCVASGYLGDRFGTRVTYTGMLIVSLAFVVPVFALGGGHTVWMWVLLFLLVGFGQGASGVLPKYVSDHYPLNIRAAALGFSYNVGALGGAAAPVLGTKLAKPLSLGTSIAVLGVAFTAVVVLLVGFNVPVRLQRAADRRAERAGLPPRTGEEPAVFLSKPGGTQAPGSDPNLRAGAGPG